MKDLSQRDYPYFTLTDAATIAVDANKASKFKVSIATGRTIGAPSNGSDGQQIVLRIKNTSGGAVTLTLTTGSASSFRFGSTITALSDIAAGKTDYITAFYDATDDRWDVVGYAKGF